MRDPEFWEVVLAGFLLVLGFVVVVNWSGWQTAIAILVILWANNITRPRQ